MQAKIIAIEGVYPQNKLFLNKITLVINFHDGSLNRMMDFLFDKR